MKSRPLVALVLLSLAACRADDEDVSRGTVLQPDSPSCIRPIAAFCRSRCLTYQESVRALEDAANTRFGSCAAVLGGLRTGVCGDLRFTDQGHAYGSTTIYYDRTGAAVAARVHDDVYSSTCDDPPFGFVPTCPPQITRDLCAERRDQVSLKYAAENPLLRQGVPR